MPKLPWKPSIETTVARFRADTELRDVALIDVGVSAAAESPFAALGFTPDEFKAYCEFTLCHTLPEVLGPVQLGNFLGFQPDSLAASHASLTHQQFNLGHKLKAVSEGNPGDPGYVGRDRIIGCVVATNYPKKPMEGWTAGQAYPIRAMAVIFKLAEGVAGALGQHLTGREKQSVSIETSTTLGNVGVHQPSTGSLWPIMSLPAPVLAALSPVEGSAMPHVGKLGDEQLICVYGLGGKPINLSGWG